MVGKLNFHRFRGLIQPDDDGILANGCEGGDDFMREEAYNRVEDNNLRVRDYLSANHRIQIDGSAVTLADGVATKVATISCATTAVVGGWFHYTVLARNAAYALQSESGTVNVSAVNVDGTMTFGAPAEASIQSLSSGTLSTDWTAVQSGNTLEIFLNANTSLTPTALTVLTEGLNTYGTVTMQ